MSNEILKQLTHLFKEYSGENLDALFPLPKSGSERQYYRLKSKKLSIIGVFNPDRDENRTFFYLSNHFKKSGIPVAEILKVSTDQQYYLLTDLGDETLFSRLINADWETSASRVLLEQLKKSLGQLARIQIEAAKGLDFSKCYPKKEFDEQSVLWDLNYFKYCFLKPSGVRFNESRLDEEFLTLSRYLLQQRKDFFHYRDFQSRNIMMVNDQPFFIDFQGGRKGPLLYDVASFLYQAKANLPQWVRDELLEYYLDSVSGYIAIDKQVLKADFPLFVVFRIIQTLGAYGYRGFFERKTHFIQSIPFAADNLKIIINNFRFDLPYLANILKEIGLKFGTKDEQTISFDGLTIEVCSFSFKNGYPQEHPEHGGGFVFDCRSLPNPGRLTDYKHLTGNDKQVMEFLDKQHEVQDYYLKVYNIVAKSVNVYSEKGFNHLSVSFGCTGGQHRSVYMANRMANDLSKIKGVRVKLFHRELNSL